MHEEERAQWTVLVVDDDEAHRYATQRALEARGFRTLSAADGPEALQKAPRADAVVLDVAMPEMSGFDVCVALRALDPDLELVVLQYSGVHTSIEDTVAGLKGGADAYLTKTGDHDLLIANLDAQLRKRARLRRLQAQRQEAIEREDQARDLFLAVLGHDLRGPMQAVMMSAGLLMRSEDASAPILRTASRILSSGGRINEMLDDLRDYALIRMGGGLVLSREPVELGELVASCVDEARAAHPTARFEVMASGPAAGSWDRGKLFRVVLNLLRNALQHGLPGEPVTIAVTQRGSTAELAIVNAGAPGAPIDLGENFEPRLQPGSAVTQHNANLGLGLYICRQIVRTHGGEIVLDNDGKATTVTVTLPVR